MNIKAPDLVVGDLVNLEEGIHLHRNSLAKHLIDWIIGDQVPADLRLLHLSHLQIDESSLTGESAPVDKSLEIITRTSIYHAAHRLWIWSHQDVALADRTNMAYMMTMVTRGRGQGIVVRTGVRTEVGKTSKVLEQCTKDKKTNLQQKLTILGRYSIHF